MKDKKNLAILTSASGGLAHYSMHLYEPLKKFSHPYFVTYANTVIDDLVQQKIEKIYPLISDNASSILMALKFLKEKEIDYINFHVGTTAKKLCFHYVALLSQAKLMGIKTIGTLHDVMPFEALSLDPAAIELLYSCIDYYIVGNESEKAKLQLYFRIPDEKISIIAHGPYTLFDSKRYTRQSARAYLNIPQEKKVVLFFGMLRPYKGLKYLIKALKKAIKEIPDVWLYISSDLTYAPQLNEFLHRIEKAGISKNIQLVKKYVPSADIEPIFKAVDIIALPYTQVSQSGVLNLAYAFKKPVIVTNIFPEASLIDYNFGRVAKTEDVNSLEECLIDLLKRPEKELRSLGEAGYNNATEHASWQTAAQEISNIIKKFN